jgi:hypothetical protein
VELIIYNVLGQKVATLVDEAHGPRDYEAIFTGMNFATGVYFCRMKADDYVQTRKLMLYQIADGSVWRYRVLKPVSPR